MTLNKVRYVIPCFNKRMYLVHDVERCLLTVAVEV